MDNFDLESLDKYINKYKRNIVNKLKHLQLTEKEMRNQADLLCMVLDYSPKIIEERKFFEKFKIKNNNPIPDNSTNGISSRSLMLDHKQSSHSDSDSDDSK